MSDSHLTEERQLINWSGDSNLPMCKPARWAIAEIVRLRAELQAANLQGIDWQSACGKAEEDHYAAREQVEQLKKQLDAAEKLIHNLTSDGIAAYFKEKL